MSKYEDIGEYLKEDLAQDRKEALEQANPSWKDMDKASLEKEQQKIALQELIALMERENEGNVLDEQERQLREKILAENEKLRDKELDKLKEMLAKLNAPKEQKLGEAAIIGKINAEDIRTLVDSLFHETHPEYKDKVTQPGGTGNVRVIMAFDDFKVLLQELTKQDKDFTATFTFKDGTKINFRSEGGKLSQGNEKGEWSDIFNKGKTGPEPNSMKNKLKDMKENGDGPQQQKTDGVNLGL